MAASDPTTDVPTPTGTLQGVAAFSWDGTTWQPAGRAGPDVATPTGVLRGVAAFNGTPWQPAGLAQPGVATPTGVLDGVAVYTWSGAAWTPAGGQPSPSTPSGVLRGVAAFNWDGAAWQPAGRAGPSVATPYGVLDGVAMFNWTGSAWAAAGASSLSLDFMQPGTLDPRITFTRASTATYFDATGTMQTAATNAPRWDYDPSTHVLRGLLIEEPRTNVLLNSAALGTQSVAVTAQAYTLSFYGTGTITMSGATTGALVGTGAFPQRVSQTFTLSAGTLTCTVTGSVLNAQLEAGTFPTSYIPTTAAAVTRAIDSCSIPPANMGWFSSPGGSWFAEFISSNPAPGNLRILGLAAGGATPLFEGGGRAIGQFDGSAIAATVNLITTGAVSKGCSTWAANVGRICLNGGAITSVAMTTGYASASSTGVYLLNDGAIASAQTMTGYIRRVQYWPRILSDAEMQAVTT